MSCRFMVSEVRPIFMIRLVADNAGIMNGGLAQVGSVAVICESRSATNCRARSSSVSGEKMSRIEDNWATDLDRRSFRPSIPFSWFSIGTVINSSTSLEELPKAIVCISTWGGANSGKTSTLVSGIWMNPRASVAAARNKTIQRNLRLVATIRRIRDQPPGSCWACASVLPLHAELGAVDLGHTLRDDLRPGRWSLQQRDLVILDRPSRHLGPSEGQRPLNLVEPGLPLLVVDQRLIVHDQVAVCAFHSDEGKVDPPGGLIGHPYRRNGRWICRCDGGRVVSLGSPAFHLAAGSQAQ